MSETLDELRKELNASLDALQTLQDEIRVKAHLAKMDARDTWATVEPQLQEVRRKARDLARSIEELGTKVV
jgi:hypothetical protein